MKVFNRKRRRPTYNAQDLWKNTVKNKELVFMGLPIFLWFLVFAYLPMAGLVMAFQDYDFIGGIFGSRWVGFENFRFFFQSGKALKLTLNTFGYNIGLLAIGMIAKLFFAIFLAEVSGKRVLKVCQSVSIFPHFISWVVVGTFFYSMFNYESGVINGIIEQFGGEKIQVYSNAGIWKYIIVGVGTWKELGYGSIVFLAAIKGIDTSIYEAAEIDGAGIWKRIIYITIPSLMPTIILLLIMSLGQVLRGNFEMFYQLVGDNPLLQESTEVIDTYVFKAVISGTEYGMTSAISLYQSIICFITVVVTNKLIKLYDADYALY